ncbi:MAG: Coenzyme F420 hydrogenase/dehydrogenase, beta subunit C-terminal domain [Muribaculaceae bacterium]|nr:Coenzyme F420 hydrogenase/dehydrogenase, beta subunit C-terminal domain [Muribaculaceae bacterium]
MESCNVNNKLNIASSKTCTGCMSCVDACKFGALSSKFDKNGFLMPKFDSSICNNCHLCEKSCPITNKTFEKIEKYESKAYTCWSNDLNSRRLSASGGAFACFAKKIIEDGGVVFGAKIENSYVKHTCIDKVMDIPIIQGSKYQQGNLEGTYKEVERYLKRGKIVLFSGVPCQIGGLKGYLRNKTYDNLYTVDLICSGFPSALPMKLFLNDNKDISHIISFRDKSNGWKSRNYEYTLKAKMKDGSINNYGYKNLPILSFGSKSTCRYSCGNCKFTGWNRISDITIGDMWGDVNYKEEHYNGLSLCITHTFKGENLLNNSNITSHNTTYDEAIRCNKPLVDGKRYFKYNLFRIFMGILYRNLSSQKISNIYLGKGLLGFMYKVNTKLIEIIMR